MFAIERQNKIREKLVQERRVDVVELSELFSVTEVTIRRDLDKLENEGFLIKTYGGALLKEESSAVPVPVTDNADQTLREKRMIGRMAASMIEPGDAVFLSPGVIGLEIARQLRGKRATVITNDVLIAAELRDMHGVKAIVTGGDLMPSTTALVGELVQKTLQGLYISRAFIEVSGVHADAGYTMDSREEAATLQIIDGISQEVVVVADYTRFDNVAFARLGDLSFAKKIITNKQVAPLYKKTFFERAIKIFTAYEFE